MANTLEKPMVDVKKLLEPSIIDNLIVKWGARIKDDKFVMSKAQIGDLWLQSSYFDAAEANDVARAHPHWKAAEGVRALIGDDYAFFEAIVRSLAVTDESEFNLAMEQAGITPDVQQRLQWVLQEHAGEVSLAIMAHQFSISEEAIRKFVTRYSKAFEQTFWRIQISKNNLEIFKSKKNF